MSLQLSIDFDAAAVRANNAILAVAAKTERKHAGWVDNAVAKLREFAAKQSQPFTIEAARAEIADKLPKPCDLRAWGQVTRKARSEGVIVLAGIAPAASSNGSPKPTYTAGTI